MVDVDSPVTTNDPYATLKTEFATAEELVRASAVLAGATDGGCEISYKTSFFALRMS